MDFLRIYAQLYFYLAAVINDAIKLATSLVLGGVANFCINSGPAGYRCYRHAAPQQVTFCRLCGGTVEDKQQQKKKYYLKNSNPKRLVSTKQREKKTPWRYVWIKRTKWIKIISSRMFVYTIEVYKCMLLRWLLYIISYNFSRQPLEKYIMTTPLFSFLWETGLTTRFLICWRHHC